MIEFRQDFRTSAEDVSRRLDDISRSLKRFSDGPGRLTRITNGKLSLASSPPGAVSALRDSAEAVEKGLGGRRTRVRRLPRLGRVAQRGGTGPPARRD
jgi:hypothetical protein